MAEDSEQSSDRTELPKNKNGPADMSSRVFGILVATAVAGVVVGLVSVRLCQAMTPTPKFCGLTFVYTAPIGCVVGALVGSRLSKSR